jgi:fatty acid desaturase
VQAVFLTLAIVHQQLWCYLLFWLILERTIGIVVQTRDHLEYYALWGNFKNHQLTQPYASRNLQTSFPVGWLMGGLNYHAVHHAFAEILLSELPTAFERI